MRHAAKRDAVEAAIVEALERCGMIVLRLSDPGIPDLLVGRHFYGNEPSWRLIEVKSPGKSLTPAQERLRERAWFPVVETVEEALAVCGIKT